MNSGRGLKASPDLYGEFRYADEIQLSVAGMILFFELQGLEQLSRNSGLWERIKRRPLLSPPSDTHQQDGYRQVGIYIGCILKGEKPIDMPVTLPTELSSLSIFKPPRRLALSSRPAFSLLSMK
jgi:hypothetical protein